MNPRTLLSATAILLILVIPSAAWAQHKHPQGAQKKPGMAAMKAEMAKMMKSPHHMLVKTHLKTMSEFAGTLRGQAVKPTALDVDFARATVAELRHNLDAIEALRQKHMQNMSAEMKAKMEAMSAEMKSKMQVMMAKMDKDQAKLKDQVSVLETDVQANTPDSTQVAAHTNALLKQLGMMSKMHGASKAKMGMK